MQKWHRISMLLCTYGFFREFRPNEPFVMEFLSGPWRDMTAEEVTQQVFPVGTYSYLAMLVVAFLITDMLRYKPLIIVSAIAGMLIYVLLLWTKTMPLLQLCQFFYGLFMATEVAYYTYIYAKVDREHFPAVTGFTKSAMLVGRFSAAVVSQLLVSFNLMDFRQLNYITLGSQTFSLLWAVLLPSVATSVYFYASAVDDTKKTEAVVGATTTIELTEKRPSNGQQQQQQSQTTLSSDEDAPLAGKFSAKRAVHLLWNDFTGSYSNMKVIEWSVWWALTTCGFTMVQTNVQFLWLEIDPDRDAIYNGAVEAVLTLLGAAAAFAAGYINLERFERWSGWVLALVSAAMGGVLLGGTLTTELWGSYVAYVLFGTATHFMVTMASINVAQRLKDDSFGLVFGINTLVSLIFATILTLVVVSETGLALGARDQFKVYSGYFAVLAVCYGLSGIGRVIWRRCRR